MPATNNNRSRLIAAAPFDSRRVIAAFERFADHQARDKCSRVEALQRACNEKPELFDEYCRAFRR